MHDKLEEPDILEAAGVIVAPSAIPRSAGPRAPTCHRLVGNHVQSSARSLPHGTSVAARVDHAVLVQGGLVRDREEDACRDVAGGHLKALRGKHRQAGHQGQVVHGLEGHSEWDVHVGRKRRGLVRVVAEGQELGGVYQDAGAVAQRPLLGAEDPAGRYIHHAHHYGRLRVHNHLVCLYTHIHKGQAVLLGGRRRRDIPIHPQRPSDVEGAGVEHHLIV